MASFDSSCVLCGAGMFRRSGSTRTCESCRTQAQHRQWAKAYLAEQGAPGSRDLRYEARTPVVYGVISAILLVLVGALVSVPHAVLCFLVLLPCYPVVLEALSWIQRAREGPARQAEFMRLQRTRYVQRLAPPQTRCAFCRCDFFRNEVALCCHGCRSLVHAACAEELLSTPGPLCPNYGCEG